MMLLRGQRDKYIFERRGDGADIRLRDPDLGQLAPNFIFRERVFDQQVHRLAEHRRAPHARQPELQVLCWKIYYSGSTVTCRQSTWDAAPRDDVQVVVVWYGKTYQTFSNGRWVTENVS